MIYLFYIVMSISVSKWVRSQRLILPAGDQSLRKLFIFSPELRHKIAAFEQFSRPNAQRYQDQCR